MNEDSSDTDHYVINWRLVIWWEYQKVKCDGKTEGQGESLTRAKFLQFWNSEKTPYQNSKNEQLREVSVTVTVSTVFPISQNAQRENQKVSTTNLSYVYITMGISVQNFR